MGKSWLSSPTLSKVKFLKKSVKIKIFSKVSEWSKQSFTRNFENNTFESLILEIVIVDIGRLLVDSY